MLGQEEYKPITKDVFVVVAAYNEQSSVGLVIEELCEIFQNVVVVNDGSSDDTAEIVRQTPARLVSHPINLGQGAALQTGIAFALLNGARYVVTFDADGQHQVLDAMRIVHELRKEDVDAVLGSRFLGTAVAIPVFRRLVLKTVVLISNLVTRHRRLTDSHNGLRGLNRAAAESLNITQNGMAHASQIIAQLRRQRMQIREVPVTIRYSKYSLSKGQTALNGINILADLFTGRFLR